jgi:hypothetical protein
MRLSSTQTSIVFAAILSVAVTACSSSSPSLDAGASVVTDGGQEGNDGGDATDDLPPGDTTADRAWTQGNMQCRDGRTCHSDQYCAVDRGGVDAGGDAQAGSADAAVAEWYCEDIPAACTTGVTCDCVKSTPTICGIYGCKDLGTRELSCGEGAGGI